MDFAFGTYTNDALKLANYRAARLGIQHTNHIAPLNPQPNQAVTITVTTHGSTGIQHVALYYTVDESRPHGSLGVAHNGIVIPLEKTSTEWDFMMWDYITHWQAVIPAQLDHTMVRYVISGWSDDGREWYADHPNPQAYVEHEAMIHFKNIAPDAVFDAGDPSQFHVFNYHVDSIKPPDWAYEAIIYQIFLDRFSVGEGKDWLPTKDLKNIWGGTLWGVHDRLDYLAELGINCLWLSPLWVTPSYHGYDVADYSQVDPRFGGDDALRAVIEGAHARGIRIVLDLVCNHLSNEHPYFVDALNHEDSPYRTWFTFSEQYEYGYKSFFNVQTMPELNLANDAARDWMIANAIYWLQVFDIDGYRLDYANGAGPDFWSYFYRACKTAKPDCFIFGEVIEPPNVLRQYYGRLDGCLDFPFNDSLRRTFAINTWSTEQIDGFITTHRSYFPDDFILPSFIDSHDMDRFSRLANNDSERLKKAVQKQFQQSNPVIIFYGSEVGVVQRWSTREQGLDMCREPMVWGQQQDQALLAFYKSIIADRKKNF